MGVTSDVYALRQKIWEDQSFLTVEEVDAEIARLQLLAVTDEEKQLVEDTDEAWGLFRGLAV
jgi:hypothetical protein